MDVDLPKFPMRAWDYQKLTRYEKIETGVELGVMIGDAEKGVAVEMVVKNSVADRAGLQKGDVLLKAGDTQLRDRFDLLYLLMNLRKGDQLDIDVERGGERRQLKASFA